MKNEIRMVDISSKKIQLRTAIAKGSIKLKPTTIKRILSNEVEKGNVIAVSKIAGILAAKQTPQLIPLCHPIPLTKIEVKIDVKKDRVEVTSTVKAEGKTGVEIEALVSTAIALITIWDMVKKYEKDEKGQYPETIIENIKVELKMKK
ncbi:MAG TPA: cyclic pyranopterin monophosphate synthase MoaC [Candidatus Atribacteria bacterium]|nr:cyclic pyranopterin monophosphate synthase MoaC [Candidatus Atribacteria bacterium]